MIRRCARSCPRSATQHQQPGADKRFTHARLCCYERQHTYTGSDRCECSTRTTAAAQFSARVAASRRLLGGRQHHSGHAAQIQAVIQAGLLPPVLQMLQSDDRCEGVRMGREQLGEGRHCRANQVRAFVLSFVVFHVGRTSFTDLRALQKRCRHGLHPGPVLPAGVQ